MANFLSLLLFLSTLLLGCHSNKRPSSPPNIVFILVDDLGWTDLSCYGSSFYLTPQLDRFAKEGMRFTNAYASCPVCSPTRASIMTGKYPTRLNITDWIPGHDPDNRRLLGPQDLNELPLSELTLAEAFAEQGYTTFFAGKWHLGSEGFYPEDQGFDINKGGHHKGSPPGGYYSPYKNPRLSNGPEGEYLPDRLTDESIAFIRANQDEPFFLFLSYYTVHTPIQPSKRHLERFQKRADESFPPHEIQRVKEHDGMTRTNQIHPEYASMVYAMDENVGRLLTTLKETGLAENTIIVFTSDNGGLSTFPEKRLAPTSVLPLRGGKGWCYEGGIRVPLIIKAPGITQAGSESEVPVISTDFYPTLLDLAGLGEKPEQHQDGLNLRSVLRGKTELDREALYWHYPHYHGSTWTPGAAIRMGKWKLITWYDWEKTELYNLDQDLGERNNLADQYPEKVAELSQKLADWQAETSAQFPTIRE
ncbi:MAG: sulfatase [Bacteroidota bacterium]